MLFKISDLYEDNFEELDYDTNNQFSRDDINIVFSFTALDKIKNITHKVNGTAIRDTIPNDLYKIRKYCSNCGKKVKPFDKYCSNCGAKM
jgi:hypothetical protein